MEAHVRARPFVFGLGWVIMGAAWVGPAQAQQPPKPILEAHVGYASFADDAPIPHDVLGGSARVYLTSRVAIGPEVTWMRGPDITRKWMLTGNATIDLSRPAEASRVVPYVIGGAGYQRQTGPVGTGSFSSSEGTFTAGLGLRISPARRWFLAPEVRLGWELHWRAGVAIGF